MKKLEGWINGLVIIAVMFALLLVGALLYKETLVFSWVFASSLVLALLLCVAGVIYDAGTQAGTPREDQDDTKESDDEH